MIFSEEVAAPLLEAEGLYSHGYTFGGHPGLVRGGARATSRSWSASTRSPTCSRSSRISRASSTRSRPSSPIAVEARGCGFFRSLELVDAALVDRVRAATRARGVIVRTDVRANPCLAISPPLISDRSQVDELAEALAGGLAEIAG